jgi:arginine deiminase
MPVGTLALGSRFGCDHLGRLTRVMVHTPGNELKIINTNNYRDWLFDSVPDLPSFQDEHERYCQLLRLQGAEVLELADYIDNVSDAEPRRLACSFVPLEPGVLVHYDTALDLQTRRTLSCKGVEFTVFHPEAMRAGGGSLRCLTLRLHRTGARSPWEQ